MASFEKIDRLNISFDKQNIKDYTLSGGSYSASISMGTTDGKTVDIKFDDTEDMKQFVENLLTAAMELDFKLNYPSHWRNATTGRWSIEDVKEWKRVHDETHTPQVNPEIA